MAKVCSVILLGFSLPCERGSYAEDITFFQEEYYFYQMSAHSRKVGTKLNDRKQFLSVKRNAGTLAVFTVS